MSERVRVLVVDDSALMRKLIPIILSRDPGIEVVGTAMDGAFALKKIEELQPDVVTLDLEMPRIDGMETLRLIMRRAPLPVILFSTHSKEGAYSTFKALALGAIDFVAKPKDAAAGNLDAIAQQLIIASSRLASPPAGQTLCNLCFRKFRRIFRVRFSSCNTCPKDLRKCLRSASMNAASLTCRKRVPEICSSRDVF